MEYLYYQQRIPQKMSKKDSERIKPYSNIKIQKIDPLSAALDDAGFKGGVGKKLTGTSATSNKKYLKKIMKEVTKKYNMKPNTGTFLIRDKSGPDGVPVHLIKKLSD